MTAAQAVDLKLTESPKFNLVSVIYQYTECANFRCHHWNIPEKFEQN